MMDKPKSARELPTIIGALYVGATIPRGAASEATARRMQAMARQLGDGRPSAQCEFLCRGSDATVRETDPSSQDG